jgi:hypothetical protein
MVDLYFLKRLSVPLERNEVIEVAIMSSSICFSINLQVLGSL